MAGDLAVRGDPQSCPSPAADFFPSAELPTEDIAPPLRGYVRVVGREEVTVRIRETAARGRASTNAAPPAMLNGPPFLDDANQHADDGQQKQKMDEPTERVVGHHPNEPHQEKQNRDRPEHMEPPHFLSFQAPPHRRSMSQAPAERACLTPPRAASMPCPERRHRRRISSSGTRSKGPETPSGM